MSDFMSELGKAGLLYGVKNTGQMQGMPIRVKDFSAPLTREELDEFSRMCDRPREEPVLFLNPHDYKIMMEWKKQWDEDYKKAQAYYAAFDAERDRFMRTHGRRMTELEMRWWRSKYEGKPCQRQRFNHIPFPEET